MGSLSTEEARRLALQAQGLRGPRQVGGVRGMVRRLGAVQLDTISVLARSHELVAYARLGAIARDRVEKAYWRAGSATFEYWSHAACVIPLADWPAYAFTRRVWIAKGSGGTPGSRAVTPTPGCGPVWRQTGR
ncbi:MAG TPA: crosslink repair DNA glycosylase YcaQ family protein [Acidimicrobiales bacterium]